MNSVLQDARPVRTSYECRLYQLLLTSGKVYHVFHSHGIVGRLEIS